MLRTYKCLKWAYKATLCSQVTAHGVSRVALSQWVWATTMSISIYSDGHLVLTRGIIVQIPEPNIRWLIDRSLNSELLRSALRALKLESVSLVLSHARSSYRSNLRSLAVAVLTMPYSDTTFSRTDVSQGTVSLGGTGRYLGSGSSHATIPCFRRPCRAIYMVSGPLGTRFRDCWPQHVCIFVCK